MSRFLIVCPPLVGHINPTISVGQELDRRGHEVAWCGYPQPLADLLPTDAALVPAGDDVPAALAAAAASSVGLRGPAALKFLWDGFILPLAHAMMPGVEAAVDRFGPDAMLVDQQALAGAVVARRRGLPWSTSATTSAELVDPLAGLPKIEAWIADLLRDLQVEYGIPSARAAEVDLRFSDRLLLAFTTSALVDGDRIFPRHWAFVGPSLQDRAEPTTFPFDWLRPDRPSVLVTLGTVNAGAGKRFFDLAMGVLADLPVRAVVVAPPYLVAPPPPNVLVRRRVPQLSLMPRLDAVVCHAGHNTVCEALAHALPMVVAPIRDDQPIVAEQVVRSGAGVRVMFGRVGPVGLHDAITSVLDDPCYRHAAARVQSSFAGAGGAGAAAGLLESLAATAAAAASGRSHRHLVGRTGTG